MEANDMNVADRIQLLRKQKGLSQEQFADEIGVSRQLVSKWENEQALPDMERVIIMSDFFDTTADYILKGIEPAGPEIKGHGNSLTEGQLRSVLLDVFLWAVIIICGLALLQFIYLIVFVGFSAEPVVVTGLNQTVKPDVLSSLKFFATMPLVWIVLILFFGAGYFEIRRRKQRKMKSN
jgi:transcriptional regulator with XRE-family HTH domain